MRKPRLRRDGLPCPRAPTWYRVARGIIPGALPFSLFQTLTAAWRCQNDVSSWIRLNEQVPSELEQEEMKKKKKAEFDSKWK